jgi:signal transduction histidine kinase
VVEEERTRIAREIHDELGQALTGLKMDLTWLAEKLPKNQRSLKDKMASVFQLIDSTIQAVRRIASGLRPEVLDEVGLAAAIGWQARDFQKRTGIRCKVDLPVDGVVVDKDRSTAAFRIFQELLTNVARHAEATKVDIALQLNDHALVLKVVDNGKGISTTSYDYRKSLGLMGIRERVSLFGGEVEIAGTRGKGTHVMVSIPHGRHA